jgi:hypothetical protein
VVPFLPFVPFQIVEHEMSPLDQIRKNFPDRPIAAANRRRIYLQCRVEHEQRGWRVAAPNWPRKSGAGGLAGEADDQGTDGGNVNPGATFLPIPGSPVVRTGCHRTASPVLRVSSCHGGTRAGGGGTGGKSDCIP